jgi:hypothetical protein
MALSVLQAASFLNVSFSYLSKLGSAHPPESLKGLKFCRIGKRVVFREEDLREFLEVKSREAGKPAKKAS